MRSAVFGDRTVPFLAIAQCRFWRSRSAAIAIFVRKTSVPHESKKRYNNGTEFLITLDEPLTEPVGTVVDVSDMNIIVSTPLDIFDSSLVQGSAFNSTMTDSAPAEIVQVQVPESSVSTVVLLSVVGFGALLRRKCNRFMG